MFLFHVEAVNTTNRKCITLNGMDVNTVDIMIDVHVLILVVLAFYTGLWMF